MTALIIILAFVSLWVWVILIDGANREKAWRKLMEGDR
jgi:hypothetical protein